MAPGTSRLRVTLSATHTDEQVDRLVDALADRLVPRMTAGGSAVRPDRLALVCGTGTEVGKTWVAARLLVELRATGPDGGGPQAGAVVRRRHYGERLGGATDAEALGAASGEHPGDVCHSFRSYHRAMAPPIAAQALGLPPFTVADLVDELAWPRRGSRSALSRRPAGYVRPRPTTVTCAIW